MSPKSEDSLNNQDEDTESQTLLPGHSSADSAFFYLNSSSQQCTCGNSIFIKWASIFCVICTLTNIVLGFLPFKSVACHNELASIPRSQLNELRRPSPYIGLDQIERDANASTMPIVNFPHVIAQVDEDHPSKVFDDDPLRYMSISGAVSPQKHEVRVTKSISTVAQFRAIDYGMENCELKVQFPKSNGALSYALDIHMLHSALYLDTKRLSYQTRPRRLSRLDTLMFSGTEEHIWSYNFTCAWDELMTFEICCAAHDADAAHPGGSCDLSWWQDEEDENPSAGIFMRQHSTV